MRRRGFEEKRVQKYEKENLWTLEPCGRMGQMIRPALFVGLQTGGRGEVMRMGEGLVPLFQIPTLCQLICRAASPQVWDVVND